MVISSVVLSKNVEAIIEIKEQETDDYFHKGKLFYWNR